MTEYYPAQLKFTRTGDHAWVGVLLDQTALDTKKPYWGMLDKNIRCFFEVEPITGRCKLTYRGDSIRSSHGTMYPNLDQAQQAAILWVAKRFKVLAEPAQKPSVAA